MAYTKTTWVNDSAPFITDANLNKIETGIFDNDATAASQQVAIDLNTAKTGITAQQATDIATNTSTNASQQVAIDLNTARTNGDTVSLADHITDFTGATDQSTEFNAAELEAFNNKKVLFHPGGTIKLAGGTSCRVPLMGIGSSLQSSAVGRSIITSTETAGGDGFVIPQSSNGFYVENILFLGSGTLSSANQQNCLGLKIGGFGQSPDTDFASRRGYLNNISIKGYSNGLDMQGWINYCDNLWVTECSVGLRFEAMNGCSIKVFMENNAKDFELLDCFGLAFDLLVIEGANGTTASTIDGCDSIFIQNLYTEQPGRTVSWLDIGLASPCTNITIAGRSHGCGEGVAIIRLDNVNGYNLSNVFFKSSEFGTAYSTTANTRNGSNKLPQIQAGFPISATVNYTDNGSVTNLFPNSRMSGIRFGVRRMEIGGGNRATISKETTTIKTGKSALRVTSVAGQGSNYVSARILNSHTASELAGKPITVAMWAYVPDIIEYDMTEATQSLPAITVKTYLADVVVDATVASLAGYHQKGEWNLFYVTLPIVTGPIDEVMIGLCSNNSAEVSTGNEYIIVDEVFLCEGYCIREIYEGRIVNNSCASEEGSRLIIKEDSSFFSTSGRFYQDALQVWEVGDTVKYTNPVAGGFEGKICVTGGAGVASDWKDIGAIAA